MYGTIEDVFTLPEQRGKGVATALLDLLHEEGKRRGYCRLELQVQEDNDNAWKFYESRGMSFTGYIVYCQGPPGGRQFSRRGVTPWRV